MPQDFWRPPHTFVIYQTAKFILAEYPRSMGMFPCTKCQICPYVDGTNVFKDAMGQKEHDRDLINCSTDKVISMLTCPCPKMYICKTKRQLKVRIGEHLVDIGKEKDRDPEKGQESPVVKHFAQYHQGKTDGLKVKGIYFLKLAARRGDRILLQKKWWIFMLSPLRHWA